MNSKITLLIDGHNFYFRNMSSDVRRKKRTKMLTSKSDMEDFEKKMLYDISNIVLKFRNICDDIIFVEDSHSWRKKILQGKDYKKNRDTDTIDFEHFGECTSRFIEVLDNLGVKHSKVYSCEGDDLIFGWCNYLKSNDISTIILSTDKDLTQLISNDGSECFTIQFSPVSNKIYISEKTKDILFKKYEDKTQLFFENANITNLKRLVLDNENEIIDSEKVRLSKVISGDSSDNIKNICERLGKAHANTVYEEYKSKLNDDFNYKYYFNNEGGTDLLSNVVCDVMKIEKTYDNITHLNEKINNNCKLIILSTDTIPRDVIEKMNEHIKVECKKAKINWYYVTPERIFGLSRFGKEVFTKPSYSVHAKVLNKLPKDINYDDMSFIKE